MLTVSGAAAHSSITEKTIRKALEGWQTRLHGGYVARSVAEAGRGLIRRSDLEAFKANGYDPYFEKGRGMRGSHAQEAAVAVLEFPRT